jgi:uncharacterized sulfatase
MERRTFLHRLASAAVATTGWAGQAAASAPPNFVIIFADDLGYGDLACYGSKTNQTPHLDRMAAEGIRFTDFYVPMPYCAPSRAALLTGRYPFRHVSNNPAPDSGINDVHLPLSEITLAETLKERGYATTCIGKWHLGHLPQWLPRKQGFDEYYGIPYSNDMRPVQIVHNETVAKYPVLQSELTRDYTERALKFIDQNRGRPFFLYLPHAMPHKPLAASEEFYTPSTPGDLYADVIRELDWSVGQILQKLKDTGLEEKTLVLFLSDNGAWFGGSNGHLRGMKASTWDGGLRVPLIARWPGRIPPGRATKEPAVSVDIFPTLCRLAGADIPNDRPIDGEDLFPLLSGKSEKTPHEAIFMMGGPQLRIVRSGKWKLHVETPLAGPAYLPSEKAREWVDRRGPDGVTIIAQHEQATPNQYPGVRTGPQAKPMMLFDLEADPAEQNDVAASNPEVVSRLLGLYQKMNAQVSRQGTKELHGESGIRRLTGGSLRYDREPEAARKRN